MIGKWKRAACAAFIVSVSPLRTTTSRETPFARQHPGLAAAHEFGRGARAPDFVDLELGIDHRFDEERRMAGPPRRRLRAGEHLAGGGGLVRVARAFPRRGVRVSDLRVGGEDERVRFEGEERRGPGRDLGHPDGHPDAGRPELLEVLGHRGENVPAARGRGDLEDDDLGARRARLGLRGAPVLEERVVERPDDRDAPRERAAAVARHRDQADRGLLRRGLGQERGNEYKGR